MTDDPNQNNQSTTEEAVPPGRATAVGFVAEEPTFTRGME